MAKSLRTMAAEIEEGVESPEFQKYKTLLTKLKGKESLNRLNILLANPRLRKTDKYWALMIDKGEGVTTTDPVDQLKTIRVVLTRELPVAPFLKKILDYGIENGYIAMDRLLTKNRVRSVLLKQEA
jgi:hypothetical protein